MTFGLLFLFPRYLFLLLHWVKLGEPAAEDFSFSFSYYEFFFLGGGGGEGGELHFASS